MSFHYKAKLFLKKTCLLVAVFAALKLSAFAQLIHSAQPANLQPKALTFWNLTIFILGTSFGASIFWWRRDKSKDETSTHRETANENARKMRAKNSNNATDRSDKEVNEDVAAWIQNNIANKKTATGKLNGVSAAQDSASVTRLKAAVQIANTAVHVFQMPEAPPPMDPLPTLGDEELLKAIEQLQDFNVTENEREAALNILLTFKSSNAVEALTQVAHYDESSRLRIIALNELGEFDHESVFEPVLLTYSDPAREVRAAAARTLARLSINRADAYTRIVESEDSERIRLASMVCLDAGLAKHAFARLTHHDKQQANEAFAIVRILIAAEEYTAVADALANSSDAKSSLAMIKALQAIKPTKMLPALRNLPSDTKLPLEVRKALGELIAELSAV